MLRSVLLILVTLSATTLRADLGTIVEGAKLFKNVTEEKRPELIDPNKPAAKAPEEPIEEVKTETVFEEFWGSVSNREIEDKARNIRERVIIEEIVEPMYQYRYASFGKPNPFVPPFHLLSQFSPLTYEIPIVSPLQVSLDQLRVRGIWQLEDGTRRALITGERSQGIIASVGDPIGPSGKITDINEEGVTARQYKLNNDGSREFEDIALRLREADPVEAVGRKYLLQPGKPPFFKPEEVDGEIIKDAPVPTVNQGPNLRPGLQTDTEYVREQMIKMQQQYYELKSKSAQGQPGTTPAQPGKAPGL